ncbi:MAG TPA: ABC transporter ATP-binding protein, partial [Chloroflexota bacterium]|nr:ABC transporter ATP-binding protein [Chloroflexota bacterium]
LAEMEDVLDGWAGTLVVVSHDRWFLERTTDSLWALPGDGQLRHLPGGVDDYLALRSRATKDAQPVSTKRTGDSRVARKELERIERRLDRIAREEQTLHQRMAEVATEHEQVLALDEQVRALATERAELEEQWLLLAEDG